MNGNASLQDFLPPSVCSCQLDSASLRLHLAVWRPPYGEKGRNHLLQASLHVGQCLSLQADGWCFRIFYGNYDALLGLVSFGIFCGVCNLIFSGLCRIDFSGNGKFKCLTSVIGSFHTLFQIYFAVCSLDGFILDSLNRRAKFQPWISRIRIGRIPSAVRTVYINTDRGRLAQWSRIFAVIDGYFGSYRAVENSSNGYKTHLADNEFVPDDSCCW